MLNIVQALSQKILSTEKNNLSRPIIKLSDQEIESIQELCLNSWPDNHSLTKDLLCVLNHAQGVLRKLDSCLLAFHTSYFESLKNKKFPLDFYLFYLQALERHYLDMQNRLGNPISENDPIVNIFRDLLFFKNWELRLWTLNSIEAMGSRKFLLKDDIIKVRPRTSITFNKHKQEFFLRTRSNF